MSRSKVETALLPLLATYGDDPPERDALICEGWTVHGVPTFLRRTAGDRTAMITLFSRTSPQAEE
jgi:hypothetical protein